MGGLLMFCGERMFAPSGCGRYRRVAEPFVRQLLAIDHRAQRNPDDSRAPVGSLQYPGSQKRVYTRHIGHQDRTRASFAVAGDRTRRIHRFSVREQSSDGGSGDTPRVGLHRQRLRKECNDTRQPHTSAFNGNTQSNRILGSLAGKCDICHTRDCRSLYDHEPLLRPGLQFIQLFGNRAHGSRGTAEPPRTTSPGQTTSRGSQTSAGST